MLRAGELLQICAQDIIVGSEAAGVSLKILRQDFAMQHRESISIVEPMALEILHAAMLEAKDLRMTRIPFWARSAESFRNVFKHRRGGATALFQQSGSMEPCSRKMVLDKSSKSRLVRWITILTFAQIYPQSSFTFEEMVLEQSTTQLIVPGAVESGGGGFHFRFLSWKAKSCFSVDACFHGQDGTRNERATFFSTGPLTKVQGFENFQALYRKRN